MTIWKRQATLAIANRHRNVRMCRVEMLGHVAPQLDDVVGGFLLRGETLIAQVLTQARAHLDRAVKPGVGIVYWEQVIEPLDESVAPWQDFVPLLHEAVVRRLLLACQWRRCLGPFARSAHRHHPR